MKKKIFSFWHYSVHFGFSILLMGTLAFTGTLFSQADIFDFSEMENSHVVQIEGKVSKKTSFNEHYISGSIPFFSQEIFHTTSNGKISFAVSDFVRARFDSMTTVKVLSVSPPIFDMEEGKAWLSTKEYAVFEAPKIRAESLSGEMMMESKNGKTAVFAADKPVKITFFSDEKKQDSIFEFFLPSGHRMIFDKHISLRKEDLAFLRFSKLQKEFLIEKWNGKNDEFLKENRALDEQWRVSVLQKITDKANDFRFSNFSASLFQFMPNTEINEAMRKKTTEDAWNFLEKKGFSELDSAITNSTEITEWEKLQFRKYAGFFQKDRKALPLFASSLSTKDFVWKGLWYYESLLFSDDTISEQNRVYYDTFALMEKKPEYFDRYEFMVSSFFKNYPKTISSTTIGFLDAIDKKLIEKETNDMDKNLRKVEIVENIFSFISFLSQEEEYLMAKAMIQNADFYLQSNEESETLSHVKRRILQEKENIENRLAFSQIGGGSEDAFWEFVANKEKAEEIREKLHGAATENKEFSVETTEKIFEEAGIQEGQIIQDASAPHFFKVVSARNAHGVVFSGSFNADKKQLLTVIIHKNGEELRSLMGYPFTIEEIASLTPAMLDKEKTETTLQNDENRPVIASEIVDMVFLIAQRDFIAMQLMVLHKNLVVLSPHVVRVKDAIPFFDEEAEKKKKLSKTTKKKAEEEKSLHEDFMIDFEYDTDTKLVTNAVAKQKDLIIHLDEESTLQDAIFSLEKEIIRQKNRKEIVDQAKSHFEKGGFTVNEGSFVLSSDEKKVEFTNLKHNETGFLFSGNYNAEDFMVRNLVIQNAGSSPQSFGKDIVFQEFIETLKKFTEQTKKQQNQKTSEKMLNL